MASKMLKNLSPQDQKWFELYLHLDKMSKKITKILEQIKTS